MPSAARLVNISTSPSQIWPRAWSGTDDKALVNFASAAAKTAERSDTKKSAAASTSALADPTSASTLSGSAVSARSKKLRACARLSGLIPLLNQGQTLKILVHRVGGRGLFCAPRL